MIVFFFVFFFFFRGYLMFGLANRKCSKVTHICKMRLISPYLAFLPIISHVWLESAVSLSNLSQIFPYFFLQPEAFLSLLSDKIPLILQVISAENSLLATFCLYYKPGEVTSFPECFYQTLGVDYFRLCYWFSCLALSHILSSLKADIQHLAI